MKTSSAQGKRQTQQPAAEKASAGSLTTAIHLPRPTWTLLRAVAFKRAQVNGGRASVSSLIVELVENSRTELERETHSDESSIDNSPKLR